MSSNLLTTCALLIDMIGTAMLMLPIYVTKAGILNFIFAILVTAIFTYYSILITYEHTSPKQSTYAEAVSRHHYYQKKIPWYQIFTAFSTQLNGYTNFGLIVAQWRGVFSFAPQLLVYTPYLTFLTLLGWYFFLRFMKLGLNFMGIGFITTIFYNIFILWLFFTRPNINNPKSIPLYTDNIIPILGVVAFEMSIQPVFMSVLKRNADQKMVPRLILITYAVGAVINLMIGFFGGYGLINRTPYFKDPQVITEYFSINDWQPTLIQVIFIMRIYCLKPQFMNINSQRIIKILDLQQNTIYNHCYAIIHLTIGLVLNLLRIKLGTFVQINGGVCLFILNYLIPIYIHTKCVYFFENVATSHFIELPDAVADKELEDRTSDEQPCAALRKQSTFQLWTEGAFLIIMFAYGTLVSFWTIYEQVRKFFI